MAQEELSSIKLDISKRNEEIGKAAFSYHCKQQSLHPNWRGDRATAFADGALWADSHPHWISIDDELPPCNVFVLTCDRQENTNLLMLAGDGRWYDKAVGLHRNITHWMYLPQAPKKGGEE